MKRILLFTVASAALTVGVAGAQTVSETDEIVTIGQRIGSSDLDKLSSPVTVLTAAEIENRNHIYVSDILRSVPGLSVNRSGPGGALTQIRMRGSEASHVLVIVDGVEMTNPTAGEFDFSGLRAADIVRIEVLRGEQSALYGSDAVGGVIMITTRAGNVREGMQASVEAGSFGTLDGQVSAVIPVAGMALSVSGGAFHTDGYDISGLNGEKDGSESRNLSVGLNKITLGPVNLSAKAAVSRLDVDFDSDRPFNGRLDNTSDTSRIETEDYRLSADFEGLGFEHLLSATSRRIKTDTKGGFASLSEGRHTGLSWAAKRAFGAHAVTVLGETETDSYKISPTFAGSPIKPDNRTYAVAGDYRYTTDGFGLTASARQDFNDRFDDAFTWRVGGTYNFDSLGGVLRGSYGTGVKNPSMIELFGFYPDSNFVGNPALKPETSKGFNIGWTQSLAGDALRASVDYFKSDLEDEIFTDFSGFPFVPRNRTTDSTREGVEFEADWKAWECFTLTGSATWLKAEENNVTEVRRPEWMASLTGTWAATERLTLTGSVDYTGEQQDTDFAIFSPVTLDAYTLVGLNAAYEINDQVTVTLRGENLTDESYQEVVGYASQGRGIFVGLRGSF